MIGAGGDKSRKYQDDRSLQHAHKSKAIWYNPKKTKQEEKTKNSQSYIYIHDRNISSYLVSTVESFYNDCENICAGGRKRKEISHNG